MESAATDLCVPSQLYAPSTHDRANIRIEPVRSTADLEATKTLFKAYVSWLGIDLAYQDFDAEMSAMPGKYAPPKGELFLARDANGNAIGCVALRPISPEACCEMKRLYVSPEGRGLGVGRALVDVVLEKAFLIGYEEMKLDTLPKMAGAISIYKKSGFVEISPYYDTPLAETIFLARKLRD